MKDRLRLTTVTGLFAIITTLSLSEQRRLAGLVLCDLVLGVFLAVPALAVCSPCLRNVDLRTKNCQLCVRPLCAFEPKSNPLNNSLVSIVSRLETVSVTIDVKCFWKLRRRKVGNMPNI